MFSKSKNHKVIGLKYVFLALAFSLVFAGAAPFLSPLCTANNWSVYEAIRTQLNQGTNFVTCEVSAPSWPNNTMSEEGLSAYRLHQKYKWAGIGFHTFIASQNTTITYQIDGISFSNSLIETDEWQQENQSNHRSILDGIKSTAENSFDPLLETSELSTTAIYLPSGLADGLASQLKLSSRNDLMGKTISASIVTGSLTQNYSFVTEGFYEINDHASYYSFLFGSNFLLTSSTVFSKLTGSRLLIQFDNVYAENYYRKSLFDYVNESIIQKGGTLDFSVTQDLNARKAIQESQSLLADYQKSKRPIFIALEIIVILLSYLFFLYFTLEWLFLQAPWKKWKILYYWPCLGIFLLYCIGLGIAKFVQFYHFGNLIVPLLTSQSFALSLYLELGLLLVAALLISVLVVSKIQQNKELPPESKTQDN
jgi:hypothetical protein